MGDGRVMMCQAPTCGRGIPPRPHQDRATVRTCCLECAIELQRLEHPPLWGRHTKREAAE